MEESWRRLDNEELPDLHSIPNSIRVIKSRIIRWARNAAGMRERNEAHGVLEEKSEGKRPLGKPRRKRKNNIKIDLQEIGRGN